MVSAKKNKDKFPISSDFKQINPRAAGIDIGSDVHYVAVSPELTDEPVKNFGCYTPDLHEMARWLKGYNVETVMMESTGVYWIPVFQVLKGHGFDVNLVDARHVSSVPGRDTDVGASQWIQKLHSYGLLRSCYLPEAEMVPLREYWRYRAELVEMASKQILLMQKALEQMNLQLHKALSDITGVTGMSILRAIIAGERNPSILAKMRNNSVKKSEDEIEKALTGDWRDEQLYMLKAAVDLFDFAQAKMAECDQKIEECVRTFEDKFESDKQAPKPNNRKQRKNQPHFDLQSELFRMTGVDLTAIDGISSITALTVISECGIDLNAFATEKHFSSWLGLCPHNMITGGKVRKRKTRKVQSRTAKALRLAAQSLHNSKTALGAFYRRMKYKLGPAKATTATAHKLACLIFRMIRYGMDYVDKGQEIYNQQYQERVLKNLHKQAEAMGFGIVELSTGQVS